MRSEVLSFLRSLVRFAVKIVIGQADLLQIVRLYLVIGADGPRQDARPVVLDVLLDPGALEDLYLAGVDPVVYY